MESKKNIDEGDSAEKGTTTKAFILDPREPFLQTWSIIFVASCVIAVSLDPLFFYLPVINEDKKCLGLDKTLKTTAIILRSVTDTIYIVNIILQLRTGFIDKPSQKLGRAKLNKDSKAIARRYLCTWSYFLIDIFVILPIPQVVISIIFSEMRGSKSLDTRKWLNAVVLFQYVPRVLRIYLSWNDLMRSASKVARAVWVKAAFNFFLYIIASHVMGAFWYFFSIQREIACWHMACKNHNGCVQKSFSCANGVGSYAFLDDVCPINTPNSTLFDFGIFLEALQSKVVKSTNFQQKFFYCFWWGLRNLSSLGQNLQTSNYVWENCFAIFISLFGLMLFLCFIENLK
ncbi:cyclic nucleotide-gated ion channel 1-like, partial [Fagus crenata]